MIRRVWRMPALTSDWGQEWIECIRDFYTSTGFSQMGTKLAGEIHEWH